MRKESLALSMSLIVTVVIYLIAAFITASFDFTSWSPFGRGFLVLIWVVCQMFVIGVYCAMWDEENRKSNVELQQT